MLAAIKLTAAPIKYEIVEISRYNFEKVIENVIDGMSRIAMASIRKDPPT
jgi:hypothetical protein